MQVSAACWLELNPAVEIEMIEVGPSFGRRREGSIEWSVVQMRREDLFSALFVI